MWMNATILCNALWITAAVFTVTAMQEWTTSEVLWVMRSRLTGTISSEALGLGGVYIGDFAGCPPCCRMRRSQIRSRSVPVQVSDRFPLDTTIDGDTG